MTRRVDGLVEQELLSRSSHDADGRALVVALTDSGMRRLRELAPAHMRGVSRLMITALLTALCTP